METPPLLPPHLLEKGECRGHCEGSSQAPGSLSTGCMRPVLPLHSLLCLEAAGIGPNIPIGTLSQGQQVRGDQVTSAGEVRTTASLWVLV
jgi:hypothetical protein